MDPETQKLIEERFAELPETIQNALLSADVEKQLQGMAKSHELHLDQWESLEREVMLTLLGFKEVRDIENNLRTEVGATEEQAKALTADINSVIFEPVRQELERQLSHPEARAENIGAMETMRREAIAAAGGDTSLPPAATPVPVAAAVQPATHPSLAPTEKTVREPLSGSYHAAQPSTARETVEGDPYRESVA